MSQNSSSVEELRKSAERSRGELAQTVGQLRTKVSGVVSDVRETVSPDHIKLQLSEYVQSSGQRLLEQARENPLQALAVGAGVAYPLAGAIRAIPMPVLLISSGLFLLGAKNQKRVAEKIGEVSKNISAAASDALDVGGSVAMQTLHHLRDKTSDGLASAGGVASSAASSAVNRASGAANSAVSATGNAYNGAAHSVAQGAGALEGVMADVTGAASAALSNASAAWGTASTASLEAARTARDGSVAFSRNAGASLAQTAQQNPLLAGGLALAAGMLIASLLPRTRVEGAVLGPATRILKDTAQDVASQGLALAQDAANAALGEAAQRAKSEGFDADGVRRAVEDIGSRVGKVVENAATTAFASVEHLDEQTKGTQTPRST